MGPFPSSYVSRAWEAGAGGAIAQDSEAVLASGEGLPPSPPTGPTGTSSTSRLAADPQLDPRHTLYSLSQTQDPGSPRTGLCGQRARPRVCPQLEVPAPLTRGDSRPWLKA